MFSQLFSRSTAFRRNSFGYRPTRFFATCSFLSLHSVPFPSVSFLGFSPERERILAPKNHHRVKIFIPLRRQLLCNFGKSQSDSFSLAASKFRFRRHRQHPLRLSHHGAAEELRKRPLRRPHQRPRPEKDDGADEEWKTAGASGGQEPDSSGSGRVCKFAPVRASTAAVTHVTHVTQAGLAAAVKNE